MMIALLHVFGTIVILFLIIIISGTLDGNRSRKKMNGVMERAAIEMGFRKKDVFDGKHDIELARYLFERYSTDKLVNRFSDIFSPILVAIEIISFLVQFGFVVLIAWLAFTDNIDLSKNVWIAVPIALLFLVLNQLLVLFCYFSTGRAPGEARGARNIASSLIKKKDESE